MRPEVIPAKRLAIFLVSDWWAGNKEIIPSNRFKNWQKQTDMTNLQTQTCWPHVLRDGLVKGSESGVASDSIPMQHNIDPMHQALLTTLRHAQTNAAHAAASSSVYLHIQPQQRSYSYELNQVLNVWRVALLSDLTCACPVPSKSWYSCLRFCPLCERPSNTSFGLKAEHCL